MEYEKEKLNIWDRFFNRYKMIVVKEGSETWISYKDYNYFVPYNKDREYTRNFVIYHKIDRLTGGFKIVKEYLN